MSNCLNRINNIDVSNGKYVIENNYIGIPFDLYDNSNTLPFYEILNVPKEYPLGFYIDNCSNLNNNNNIYNDISNIIKYESNLSNNVKIYVSRGNDLSFNNGDYFRFYDESFNLLNISKADISTNNFLLTASADNFYFMKGVSYEFISTFDFSTSSPFGISGDFSNSPLTLNEISENKILYIDNYSSVNNSNNRIYYYDLSKETINGNLEFLVDNSGINYYYGDVKFKIMNSFPSHVSLSIKSYPKYDLYLSTISNEDLFRYNDKCNYVIEGFDFNQYSLKNNNSECLTKISRADICLNYSKVFYEFNKQTHNDLIKDKIVSPVFSLNDLKYGIYDGSYVIFDICENYPITISSDYITIIENYPYTKKYESYSSIVQNLNIDDPIYKNYTYYYGAIQFSLNSDGALTNDFSFDLFILNKSSNNISLDSSNSLIYTDFCEGICGETNFLTNLDNKEFTFKLKNQANNIFEQADLDKNENIYKLNKYDSYIELTNPYIIEDKYGHTNLENLDNIILVISSAPSDFSSTQLISNNFTNSFVITYDFTYFDSSNIQLTRLVDIIDNVFIEFSESIQTKLFKNQSQYTNIIEISTNFYDESFNFFNDLEVFIKPNKDDKIFLPYEITITGIQLNQNLINESKNVEIVNYNVNKNNANNYINFNNLNHYLTDKILYIEKPDLNNIITIDTTYTPAFIIQYISSYSVEKNSFFYDISSIFSNSNNINDNSGSELRLKGTNNNNDADKNLINNLVIYDISNNLQVNDNSYTNIIYLHASNNIYSNIDISFILTLFNENNIDKFKFEAIANKDLSQNINAIDFSYSSDASFTISGEFFKNDFFKNKNSLIKQKNKLDLLHSTIDRNYELLDLLDSSFNGNYEFKIDVKGLESGDFIFNEISNNYGINRTDFSLSKIIYINVIDNTAPVLFFAKPDKSKIPTNKYDFTIPYGISFDILNDILFLNEKKATTEDYKDANPNKPIIVYNENSIYNINKNLIDISYNLFNPINIDDQTSFIKQGISNEDSSAVIVYNVKDLCNNISNDISLTIIFKNIPSLRISGEAVIEWDVNTNYYDAGLFIDTNHFTGISGDVSINEPSNNSFLNKFFTNNDINNDISYNITFSTDFSSSKIGTYEISYNVNFSNDPNAIAKLRRTINVVDRKKPFVRLFDFSGTNFLTFIDASNGLSTTISNEIFNELSYNNFTIDNSNTRIIDFSLTYLSSFHDLSRIIHAFDLCDNYTKVGTNTDNFSTNIILNISNNEINFSNSNFSTNDLSYNTISYLNNDNSFIHLTQGIGSILPPLVFNYQIIDSCDNIFNFTRTVNIVDVTKPTIDFSLNTTTDPSYITYSTDKTDFSYQAFDYSKNQIQFLQEIQDIIFNFQINDNYTENNYSTLHTTNFNSMQNNYNITISANIISNNITFKNFNDFSNTIQNNLNIINLFKTFDNSFELIYDFSDNQYNSNFQKRRVNIVNEIKPTISVIADSEIINISFGDTSLNLTSFFNLSHPRLTNSDLSFELSYNLPTSKITSISNNDSNALIYKFQDASSRITFNDISFFNIATNSIGFDLSSSTINPLVNINIVPTNFEGFNNITHEAGVYLSDASLINGLTVTNEFDRFYYTLGEGSFNDISYSGSIFDICYIRHVEEYDLISFNEFQSDPSLIGEYRITYSLTNQNNYTEFKTRNLSIQDTILPEFGNYESNVEVNINNIYIEPGITFSDYGSRLNRLEYKIEKIENNLTTEISNNTTNNFANLTTGSFINTPLLSIEDTSNSPISYIITYIIYDNADLSSNISRTINVVNLNNLIIKPIIRYRFNIDSSFIEQILDSDFSSNSLSNYDISFYYVHSSKTIFYEATNLSLFNDLIEFSYNYILPQQLGSNVIFDNLQFFDPIESIIPNKVDNYLIFFQIFNNETFFNNLETINFNVIDNRGPKLNFETNNEYPFRDICNIVLPLLSNNAYQELSNNINYFNKLEEKYPSFTKSNLNEEIIFSIPGVVVDDIVDNITTTLSNESFDTSFNKIYDISVSYKISGGINDGSYVDASYLLTNSGNYIQNYIITDSNNNPSDITRNITIKQFNPFIVLSYNIDICNNFYKKRYHKHYENYYDLNARAYDFSYIDVSYNIRDNNFNKNNLGLQRKTYITTNKDGLSSNKDLDIHIVNIDILKKDISLSSIIQDYNSNNPNNSNDENYKRYGVYKNNTYNIVTDGSSNAFRIVNDDSDNNIVFNTGFLDPSYINLNNIVNLNSNNNILPFNNNKYYYNNVSLQVNGDFNRLSIEYLDTSGTTQITRTLKDIILYNQYFETQNVESNLSESIIERSVTENSFNEIIVKVSNDTQYIGNNNITDVKKAFYLTHNNEDEVQRKTLYLPLGKYKFIQKDYTNFYNPIKFSYLPDGHFYDSSFVTNVQAIDLCNIGLTIENNIDFSFSSYNDSSYQKYEYTRGVQHFGLAGFNTSETGDNSNNGCTTLIISPTTPNPLFYYCKNFPKMGGIIYVTSNLVLYKNIINLNGSILTKENNISFANYYEPSYNEISNNLVFLSQHFEISNNNTNIFSKKKHHTIGLTQQNINHNIIFLKDQSSKKTNKLIFKKYQDSSNNKSVNSDFSYITNYKITEDNSTNYLYDSSATQLKTDILMYDFHIDTSNNIINSNNSYDYDINKIFFNNNELFNYYYYFKKYNLLQEDLISTSFKYRIGEVAFINSISIKNSEEEINFYDNLFFNNNRIVLEPLFQNKINLNLQVYIDPSSLTNPEQRLEDYNSEKLKYNLSNYQNIIDPSKILFQEYFINIFSNISGEFPGLIDASDQSIIFVNGNIELKDYLLDSSYTLDLLENYVHNNLVNDLSLENIIYLGLKDNDTSNNLFCGLTQQNIYHNMFIDEQDRFIFHPYRDNTYNNIYELNNIYNSSTRATNIKKLKNEKNYLIEVSSNDLYNTLIPFDVSDNIYSKINVSNKNRYMDPSNITYDPDADFKFKTRVSYKIYNELSNNDIKLNSLDIRPITLNDISNIYELYPYAYDASLQETHSHSYKINLIEHIDRNFYKNREKIEETGLTYKNIHYSKLYFVIKDISYNTDFNLYDSAINQNILYDKSKISILNNLVPKIFIINFKLDYFYEIINSTLSTLFNYDPKNYTLINVNNYQDLTTLISGDFIDTTYSLELPNVSLNRLFSVVLNNSITIINKYKSLLEVHDYYSNEYFITNNYNNLLLKEIFEQINQIENDVNLINNNIDLLIEEKIFNSPNNIFLTNLDNKYILNQRNLNYNADDYADVILNEFQILLDLIIDFTKYKQEYNQINYELNLRGIISDEDMSNNDFIDLYKFYDDISGFYGALIDNMKKLNKLYLHDISNSNQVVKYITGEYWRVSNNYVINVPTILESDNLKIYIDDINNFLDNTSNVNYFRNINYSDLNFIDSRTAVTSDISFQIFFWIKPYNIWTDVSKSEILDIEHYILSSNLGTATNHTFYKGAIHITVKFTTAKGMEINFRVGNMRFSWNNIILTVPNLSDIGEWILISIDGNTIRTSISSAILHVVINYYNLSSRSHDSVSDRIHSRYDLRDIGYYPIIGDIYSGWTTSRSRNGIVDKNFLNLSNRTTQIKSFSIYNKRQFHDIQDFILITRPLLTNIEINTNLINTNLINFNNADFSSQFFIHLSNSLYVNLGIIEFSNTLYDISYNKYDLSLLKYFSDEISNNKIIDKSNILITHDSYIFTISNDIYNSQTNSKDFSYNISDYYHDKNLNTDALIEDSSGIKLLKEDSYILNFNRSIYNQSIDEAYDHLTKSFNFDTINYILNGQELVINSFKSNNIVIEFDVYYNSYLYPNIYLDTIILDTFIPDLTPPTILFKTEVIDISQSSLDNDISNIARLLINDISYIDIYSNSDISFDNDISFSYRNIGETSMNYLNNNVDDSSFVNIYIDISQVANATRPNDITYVYYTIYDNVNNMNIVKRRVNVVDLILSPIVFYYYATTLNEYKTANGEDKFDLLIKKGDMLTDNIIMKNIRAKDTETDTFINLNNISYTLADGLVVNQIVTLEPGTYNNVITYSAKGIYNNIETISRNIRVLEEDIIGVEPEPETITHCCYPAVYYKPIQHNYKLGSSNSVAMRMAKFIINN